MGDERYSGDRQFQRPLAAVQMGLIYVNPEGPNGSPDPVASGREVRETFRRMAMNDEETVALIVGGHTVGKARGAGDPKLVGPEPEGAPLEQMGPGWKNALGVGGDVPRLRQAWPSERARIRLAPQKDREVNQPAELAKVLQTLQAIQREFNGAQSGTKKVSLADLIVLAGCAAVEEAAKNAGHGVKVPFSPGRTDASQEQTDVESFAVPEPRADGFRNYLCAGVKTPAEEKLANDFAAAWAKVMNLDRYDLA